MFGPVPIVAGAMVLTDAAKTERGSTVAPNEKAVRQQSPARSRTLETVAPSTASGAADSLELVASCQRVSGQLEKQLGPECHVTVHAPFVMAGDMKAEELEAWHRQTIAPAARAMAHSYFKTPPGAPITILLFQGEQSYNQYAKALYGDRGISVYGYYKPHLRTLVMNIATGGGTLVHELTHALADFDFPKIPAWFNEGLASLHEQCRFRESASGNWIEGLENWRLKGLQDLVRQGRLRSLESLVGDDDFRGAQEGANYAQARYFCLYLQRQGLLAEFYRRFRDGQEHDPLGLKTLAQLFPDRSWVQLDRDFQAWVLMLHR